MTTAKNFRVFICLYEPKLDFKHLILVRLDKYISDCSMVKKRFKSLLDVIVLHHRSRVDHQPYAAQKTENASFRWRCYIGEELPNLLIFGPTETGGIQLATTTSF